ncbi:MAG: hypothetical protein WCX82_02970 [archaeon]|jgi:hypothetical protein
MINYKKLIKTLFLFFFIGILTGVVFAYGPLTEPCWIKGTATAGAGITTVEGLTVEAYDGSTLLKSGIIASGAFSLNSIGANDGDTISIKVYGAEFDTFTFEGFCKTGENPWIVLNAITIAKQANGVSCSNNAICTSGYCNSSNVCATEVTGGGGSSSGGLTTLTTTTETYSSIDSPSASEIRELLVSTGLSTNEIQAYVDAINSGLLSITTTLNVVKTGTGSSATYKSTFTITIRNNSGSNMEDITVVQVIPKNIASDASQIISLTQYRVLVADPVLEFTIASLNAGQYATIIYSIKDNVTEAEFKSMSGAVAKGTVVEATPIPVTEEVIEEIDTTPNTTPDTGYTDTGYIDTTIKKSNNNWIYWLIGIVIVLTVVRILFFKKNNHRRKRL